MARAARASTRIDAALLVICTLLALLAIVLPAPARDAIAAGFQRTLSRPLLALQQRSERARAAFVEREGLTARIDSLSLQVTELQGLDAENARLRRLLAMSPRVGRGFVPAEALHGQVTGESHTVLVTVGSRAGVVPNSPVVAPDGVVGRVTSVSPTSSQVILWSHPDFRVSAMSADGGTFGIVTPHLKDGASCEGMDESSCAGPERLLLEMRGVAFRDVLKQGTLVVSSGLGGVFPKGMAIGTVIGELKTTEQWTRTYLVRPATRPQDLSNVLVLAPGLVREELPALWNNPNAAEVVMSTVIAAGDSITRQAAAALVDARRRADSVTAARDAATQAAKDSVAASLAADSIAAGGSAMTVAPSAQPPVIRPPRRDSTPRRP